MIALVTRDLLFLSKVTGTGMAVGVPVSVCHTLDELRTSLHEPHCVAVLLDLSGPVTPDQVKSCLPPTRHVTTLAFGPHVDTNALANATAAGFDRVLPRSQFSAQLPAILQGFVTA